ncbi:MAG: transposase [Candidatus Doudnabacteria bacterium]
MRTKSVYYRVKMYIKLISRHLWARGYFVSTIGITDNIIRAYIQRQRQEELDLFKQTWK